MDASIEIIKEVIPHPDADRLDISMVLGYECVTQKGLYKGGEKIVFIRPDAVLPMEPWAESYRVYSPKRIKAVRLRNVWSEGIIVSQDVLGDVLDISSFDEGVDVSNELGIVHYEPPMPQDLQAKASRLPYDIPKTDEKRSEELREIPYGDMVDVTLKIDGQSCSFYYNLEDDVFGVLGRSMEYKIDAANNYTNHVAKYDIETKLRTYCKKYGVSLCIRGESYGQGIQNGGNNPHSKVPKGWAMFSVYDITKRKQCMKGDLHYFVNVAAETGLPTVPVLEEDLILEEAYIKDYATSKSIRIADIDRPFEGVVINATNITFKVISKLYDSKK